MKPLLISTALAACLFAVACSQETAPGGDAIPPQPDQETVAETVSEEPVVEESASVVSLSPDVKVLEADFGAALPALPSNATDGDVCSGWNLSPETAAGRQVAGAGWTLLEELPLGEFHVLSFAGSLDPATSGSCYIDQSYVGIFDGETPVAVLKAAADTAPVGRVTTFEDKGRGLRIWDGDIAPSPVADIKLTDAGTIEVVPLAAEEKFCGDFSVVPNIYGQPLSQARATLATYGWEPHVDAEAEAPIDIRAREMREQGIEEITDCSGTGFGYCAFEYRRPESALTVTTIGDADDPAVHGYDLRCAN